MGGGQILVDKDVCFLRCLLTCSRVPVLMGLGGPVCPGSWAAGETAFQPSCAPISPSRETAGLVILQQKLDASCLAASVTCPIVSLSAVSTLLPGSALV